jgi:hypothetical protein
MMHKLILATTAAVALIAAGCVESQPRDRTQMFKSDSLDACLVVSVDLSGSFANEFADRAYPLLIDLMDRFFTASMGDDCKIVLSQMSEEIDRVVLFDGTPAELRRRFANPDELSKFLLENSKPNRSPIFEATGKTLGYINAIPNVDAETRLLTVLISDMKDSETDRAQRSATGHRMLTQLQTYQETGGALALYFVDLSETWRWQEIITRAGFKEGQFLIANDLVESAPLPEFD